MLIGTNLKITGENRHFACRINELTEICATRLFVGSVPARATKATFRFWILLGVRSFNLTAWILASHFFPATRAVDKFRLSLIDLENVAMIFEKLGSNPELSLGVGLQLQRLVPETPQLLWHFGVDLRFRFKIRKSDLPTTRFEGKVYRFGLGSRRGAVGCAKREGFTPSQVLNLDGPNPTIGERFYFASYRGWKTAACQYRRSVLLQYLRETASPLCLDTSWTLFVFRSVPT